jgi:hypothetical protein
VAGVLGRLLLTPGSRAVIDVRPGVSQAAANWIWLVPGDSFESAIFVGEPASHTLAALRMHVERVVPISPGAEWPPTEIRDLQADWAYVDLDYMRRRHGSLVTLCRALKQVLRRDGQLCLASRATDGRIHARIIAHWRMNRALGYARHAGFSQVRRYHAVPDPDAPITLIPASRDGATAYELLSEPVPRRELRLRVARSALYPLLFRGYLCLCSA